MRLGQKIETIVSVRNSPNWDKSLAVGPTCGKAPTVLIPAKFCEPRWHL